MSASQPPIYWVDLDDLATITSFTTMARGVDYYAVERCHFGISEWAEMTGRNRSTVYRNVMSARGDLP